MNPSRRSIGIAATTAALGLLLATLPTGAAFAGEQDEQTDTVYWEGIDDVRGYIDDASSLSEWTSDAFDAFGEFTVRNAEDDISWEFNASAPAARTEEDGAIVYTFTSGEIEWPSTPSTTVDLRLTLAGSFARWEYAITGYDDLELQFTGDIGADEDVVYTSAETGIVSDDDGQGDPVLGFSATTDGTFTGWTAIDGDDELSASATGASQFSVTVVYGDYNPCGFDEALEFITSITPDLASVFGTAYGPIGTCLSVPEQTVTVGTPIDLVVPFTFAEGVTTSIFSESAGLEVTVSGLPAGLTGVVEYDADGLPLLHLTGTPTASGTVEAVVTFVGVGGGEPDPDLLRAVPVTGPVAPGTVLAAVSIQVVAAAPAAAGAKPALAATGFDGGLIGGAAALLALLGAAAIVLARRSARA